MDSKEAAARVAYSLGNDYKARKEAFVANLNGSSITEINNVTLVVPAAILLWSTLQRRESFFTPYNAPALTLDFFLNVCAVLLNFTIASSTSTSWVLTAAFTAAAVLLPQLLTATQLAANGSTKQEKVTRSKDRKDKKPYAKPKTASTELPYRQLVSRPFLTHYRGTMMVVTVIAILAVDFPAFPRRFAKVETWGTSLMDLGVGSFVFAAGVVSARELFKAKSDAPVFPLRLIYSFRHSIPLLILGTIRFLSVKGVDYAEHVTEYGVHWNFFFTLGCLPPFVTLIDALPIHGRDASHAIIGLLISAIYEYLLNNTRLLAFILTAPRIDLLSQNREGVFSFIGYLVIYLKGRSTGRAVLPLGKSPFSEQTYKALGKKWDAVSDDRIRIIITLLSDTLFNTTIYFISTRFSIGFGIPGFNIRPSRRLANLPYVFWICAYNTFQILVFAVIEASGPDVSYSKPVTPSKQPNGIAPQTPVNGPTQANPQNGMKTRSQNTSSAAQSNPQPSPSNQTPEPDSEAPPRTTSPILSAFNSNGLAIFLIANLLTGVVNLSINTLDASNAKAIVMLLAYAGTVTAVALGLDHYGIRLKL